MEKIWLTTGHLNLPVNPILFRGSYPKYAETPMPGYEDDDETDSDIDIHTTNSNSGFLNTLNVLILSILVILIGMVWDHANRYEYFDGVPKRTCATIYTDRLAHAKSKTTAMANCSSLNP